MASRWDLIDIFLPLDLGVFRSNPVAKVINGFAAMLLCYLLKHHVFNLGEAYRFDHGFRLSIPFGFFNEYSSFLIRYLTRSLLFNL